MRQRQRVTATDVEHALSEALNADNKDNLKNKESSGDSDGS